MHPVTPEGVDVCTSGLGYGPQDGSGRSNESEPELLWNCGCPVRDLRAASSSTTLRQVFAQLATWHIFPGRFGG